MTRKLRFQGFSNPNYTQVPDDVFDVLLPHLGGAELKALLYIIRRTFGFKKQRDPISFNQFLRGIRTREGKRLDRGCGIRNRTTLSRALTSLQEMGIIQSDKGVDALGDNATTIYTLCFSTEGDSGGERVVRKLDHPGTISSPPVVRNVDPQETATQETVLQPSKLRKVAPPRQGMEPVGAALARRSVPSTSAENPSDREILTAYMESIALELRDQAPLRSTVTRLLRIYERSTIDAIQVFVDVLYQARAIAREHTSSVRAGEPGARRIVPYFIAVVEDVVGLKEGGRSRH